MSSKQNLYLDWKQVVTHKKKGKRIQATKQRAGKNPNTKSKPVTHSHTHRRQTRGNTGPPPETSW